MVRRVAGVALAIALLGASGASAGPSRHAAYPLIRGFHFTGTPLALAFYNAGSAGTVGLMYEYNKKGPVPGSYVGLVTRGWDAVGKVTPQRKIVGVEKHQRSTLEPGYPDPFGIIENLLATGSLPAFVEEAAQRFYVDPGTQTVFTFFVNPNDSTILKLVSNPEDPNTKMLIPGAAAFQISVPKFEIFPIGTDGHTSTTTKEPDLMQPPLTPNLDALENEIEDAMDAERRAIYANTHRPRVKPLKDALADAVAIVKKAEATAKRAGASGELTADASARVANTLNFIAGHERSEYYKDGSNRTEFESVGEVAAGLARDLKSKRDLLKLVSSSETARKVGK